MGQNSTKSPKLYLTFSLLFTATLLLLMVSPAKGQMCLPTWKYRVPVTINNAGNGALTNYQVKITMNTASLVTAGKMRADGGDIRFTQSDCCTPVCHWVKSGINTNSTVIWIKVPSLPAGGTSTVYLHYGDTTQTSTANGDCVFEFFDDFNGTTLDPVKWTTRGTPSGLVVSGSIMTITGNSNWEYIRSNTTFSSRVKIHDSRRHSNSTGSAGFLLGYAGVDNRYTFRYNATNLGTAITYDTDIFGGNAWFNQTYPLLPYPVASFNDFETTAEIISNTITLTNVCNVTAANCNSNTISLNTITGSAFYVGYSSFSNLTSGLSDCIFVRKFTASVDPSTSLGSEFSMPARPLATTADEALCAGTTRLLNAGAGHFSYLWNNAATTQTQSFTFPPADTVWCTIQDGMGCVFTDSVIITTLPLPANFMTQDTVTICPGDTTVLDASPGFVSYIWNCGDTTQLVNAFAPMDYIATVEDTNGCVGSDTTWLFNYPNPVVNISPATFNLCPGDSVTLDAGAGFVNYLWLTLDTTQTLDAFAGGQYSVEVTDTNGCTGMDTAMVNAVSAPVVNITPDSISVCEGITACLDAGPGFLCYIWNEGSATQSICPSLSGIYYVEVCDSNGCTNVDTAEVVFLPAPVATITQSGDTLTSSPAVTYQWLLNGSPIGGATNQTHIGLVNGDYQVVITDANGCTDTSAILSFVVGLNQPDLAEMNLFPNPTQGALYLESGLQGEFTWNIYAVTGALQFSGRETGANRTVEISTNGLSEGMYLLEVVQGDARKVIRFVKE